MYLCSCCLIEKTGQSLETNTLSTGANSLQQAFKERSAFSSLTSVGVHMGWISLCLALPLLAHCTREPLSPSNWF